jgi:copper resistance protein D
MDLLPVVRGVHIGSTLLLAGAAAFELLVAGEALRSCDTFIARRVRSWIGLLGLTGMLVGVTSWLAWLALLAVSMSGLPVSEALTSEVLRTMATRTTFGHVWSVRMGLYVVAGVQLASAWRGTTQRPWPAQVLHLAIAAALVASLAWTGHAVGPHPAHLAADAIHLLAAAAWLGMIAPLWLIVRRASSSGGWDQLAVSASDRFFWPGVTAVIALAASGVINATWLVDSVADLLTTRYGLLLVGKVAFFGLMVVAATINRSLTRRLRALTSEEDRRARLRALGTSITVELLCGLAAIAVVAQLGVTPPPAHEHAMHHMEGM